MICNSLCFVCLKYILFSKVSKSSCSSDLGHGLTRRYSLFLHYSDSSLKPSSCCLLPGTADSSYQWDSGPGRERGLGLFFKSLDLGICLFLSANLNWSLKGCDFCNEPKLLE